MMSSKIMGMGNFLVPRPKVQRKIRMISDAGELDICGENA